MRSQKQTLPKKLQLDDLRKSGVPTNLGSAFFVYSQGESLKWKISDICFYD